MYGGTSGSQSLLVYNTKLEGDNAVLGCYKGDEIQLLEGSLEKLKIIKDQMEEPFKNEKTFLYKAMLYLLLIDLVAVIGAFVWGGFRIGLAMLIFGVGSYMPMLVIIYARQNRHQSEELHRQFAMHHGCEHAAIQMLTNHKGKEISMEKLKKESIYDSECGTAYSGYAVTVFLVLGLLIAFGGGLGLLKSMGILLGTIVLLLINIFNPYNPYLLLQKPVVSKPDERTYELGLAVCERLREMETN